VSWVEKREELVAVVERAKAKYKAAEQDYEEAKCLCHKAEDELIVAKYALQKHDSEATPPPKAEEV